MFSSLEKLPVEEMSRRHALCREFMVKTAPEAGGFLVSSRLAIYYLSGTYAHGLLWLPLAGEPVLMVRKGVERARMESLLTHIMPFKSYREVPGICADAQSPLSPCIAVDKSGFSWAMADMLQKNLPGTRFVSGDAVLRNARRVKSEWELVKLRLCGERHRAAQEDVLPQRLKAGMTELEIAHLCSAVFFELGNGGPIRMNAHSEENFGLLAVGDSGNYPTYYNGPLGHKGLHPAIPFMGDAGTVWMPGMLLATDLGFTVEGYNTDKTQVYWSGPASSIPDELQRAHDLCEELYLRLVDRLKPGAIPSEFWTEALTFMERAGCSEGFMGLGGNKVPFIGHGTGLTVDDLPVFAAGFDEPLEPGMVVALEPKIGLAGIGMTGVENTLEITADGARSLSGSRTGIICIE